MNDESNVSSNPVKYNEIIKTEGKCKFYLPVKEEEKIPTDVDKKRRKSPGKDMAVFYNDKMIINRDLTTLMVKIYGESLGRKIKFLDAMAATGVRAIRLLKETEVIEKVFINDLNPKAIRYAHKNLELNSIEPNKYEIFNEDSKKLLFRFRYIDNFEGSTDKNFIDVIDIDPFGTPSQYIPAAMQSIEIGGMLCVTATDTPVLFGIRKKTCVRKYLTKPIRTEFIKEMGTRILIYYLAKIAHLYELSIEPILSISSDHFVRIFLIIERGITRVNQNIRNFGNYIYCPSCGFRGTETFDPENDVLILSKCEKCGRILRKSGLLWLGNLHSKEYQDKLLNELKNTNKKELVSYNRIHKFLTLSHDEDKMPPYYFSIPKIADSMNARFPSLETILNRCEELGFKSSRTHFDPQSIKTFADIDVIRKILQEFNST